MDNIRAFEQAIADSKTLLNKPSDDVLLLLYSYYKQATQGDAPEKGEYNMFDFVAKAKHNAWLQQKGLSAEEARKQYIALVATLKEETN